MYGNSNISIGIMRKSFCLNCSLRPIFSLLKTVGLDILESCENKKSNLKTYALKIYSAFVQLILFVHAFSKAIEIFYKLLKGSHIGCLHDHASQQATVFFASLFCIISFSCFSISVILENEKFSINIPIDFEEYCQVMKYQRKIIMLWGFIYFSLIMIFPTTLLLEYFLRHDYENIIPFLCGSLNALNSIFEINLIIFLVMQVNMILYLIKTKISVIQEAIENAIEMIDHRKMQRNMKNHEAVYRFLNHINYTFENCIFISYFSTIYALCLCIYNVTIGGSEILFLKYLLIPATVIVSLTLFYISYEISKLFIRFYGCNQEIRKFSISSLPIQIKLKVGLYINY
ncbi:uncharacterized protein [Centruroides vittatus]|uniref:uncharacterized protein n=1 Tax=Centruroides vittatus TaxID=120091 RepID=UPI0035106283